MKLFKQIRNVKVRKMSIRFRFSRFLLENMFKHFWSRNETILKYTSFILKRIFRVDNKNVLRNKVVIVRNMSNFSRNLFCVNILNVPLALNVFTYEENTDGGNATNDDENETKIDSIVNQIETATLKSTDALIELMHTLNLCMVEISKQYRECMEKQIQITDLSIPTDENWDELTKYRVEANELKTEFTKYELLLDKVGQMVFNHAVTSLMGGNEAALDVLNHEYNRLVNFVQNLVKENKELESRLLLAKRNNIIQGLPEDFPELNN